ncbi:MAG: nucleotidyltransferase domain-containing protein [Candidatus Helarchaeota archaeon]
MIEDWIKNQFIKTISKFDRIILCYIFGSVLKRDNYNDIDIGIVLKNIETPYYDWKYTSQVGLELESSINFSKIIDIKDLNHCPIYFQFNVIKNGELIYYKDEKTRIKYETKIINLYLDYKEMYNWFQTQILERK